MKYFFALCCFLTTALLFPGLSAAEWLTDFQKAQAESLKTGRPIYILFTKSDMASCRSYDRAFFSQKRFLEYADKSLVLMKVELSAFTRQPRAIQQQNEELRVKYGVAVFPTSLLLNPEGAVYVDFVKADGGQEKHLKKINPIIREFDSAKLYADYVDGFVKKYNYTPTEGPKEEAKPATKTPAKKPAKKPDTKQQTATEETTIPDENGGIPLIPIKPEGNFQDWLKASTGEEAAEAAKAEEEAKEIVEEEKEIIEAEDKADEKATEPADAAKTDDAKAEEAKADDADAAKTDETQTPAQEASEAQDDPGTEEKVKAEE